MFCLSLQDKVLSKLFKIEIGKVLLKKGFSAIDFDWYEKKNKKQK